MPFEFPHAFVQRMRDQGLEPEKLYSSRVRKSIRFVSRAKQRDAARRAPLLSVPLSVSSIAQGLEQVAWWPSAYWIDDPRDFSQREEFRKGVYYIQDPASVIPVLVMDIEGDMLDMCAAPGTKAVLLSELMKGRLFVNDSSSVRIRVLEMNLRKYGCSYVLSRKDGLALRGSYDSILLDAPCSGEGMVNKAEKVFSLWSEDRVHSLAEKQHALLTHAYSLLKPGGSVVYSTCTFEREENEGVVERVAKETGATVEKISLKDVVHEKTESGIRLYPYHNGTGGFFVAKLRKA